MCGPAGTHKERCLRTIAPRENGGNMDVKQMQVGTTLLLPCFVDGCLLSIGDVHFAQGDGEVSGTAIEMDATVTVQASRCARDRARASRSRISRGATSSSASRRASSTRRSATRSSRRGWCRRRTRTSTATKIGPLTNLSEDVTLAARDALLQMVEWIHRNKGLTREQAYVLSSVAVDLRIGNLVDMPNFAVSAILDLGVFDK